MATFASQYFCPRLSCCYTAARTILKHPKGMNCFNAGSVKGCGSQIRDNYHQNHSMSRHPVPGAVVSDFPRNITFPNYACTINTHCQDKNHKAGKDKIFTYIVTFCYCLSTIPCDARYARHPSFRYRAGYEFPSQWPCLTEPWRVSSGDLRPC